jgi:hypothetical protein
MVERRRLQHEQKNMVRDCHFGNSHSDGTAGTRGSQSGDKCSDRDIDGRRQPIASAGAARKHAGLGVGCRRQPTASAGAARKHAGLGVGCCRQPITSAGAAREHA